MNLKEINNNNKNIIIALPNIYKVDFTYSKKSKDQYNVLKNLDNGFNTINGVECYKHYNGCEDYGGYYEWFEVYTSTIEDLKTIYEWFGETGRINIETVKVLPKL